MYHHFKWHMLHHSVLNTTSLVSKSVRLASAITHGLILSDRIKKESKQFKAKKEENVKN